MAKGTARQSPFTGITFATCGLFLVGTAAAEDSIPMPLSAEALAETLFQAHGLSIPTYLGCQAFPEEGSHLPVFCKVDGTEIAVSELVYEGFSLGGLIDGIQDTGGWVGPLEGMDALAMTKAIEWSVEPHSIWVSVNANRKSVCVMGRPSGMNESSGRKVHNVSECISVTSSEDDISRERTLKVLFSDFGKFSYFTSQPTDAFEFENTVTFFMLRTFALPGFGQP